MRRVAEESRSGGVPQDDAAGLDVGNDHRFPAALAEQADAQADQASAR